MLEKKISAKVERKVFNGLHAIAPVFKRRHHFNFAISVSHVATHVSYSNCEIVLNEKDAGKFAREISKTFDIVPKLEMFTSMFKLVEFIDKNSPKLMKKRRKQAQKEDQKKDKKGKSKQAKSDAKPKNPVNAASGDKAPAVLAS